MEYGPNALLTAWRRLLGPGYEKWGEDLASPGEAQLAHEFKTSLGMGGREPVKRAVEAYYGSRKGSASGAYKGVNTYVDYRELLDKEKDVDAVYVATPDHWHATIALAAMRRRKHVLGQKPMAHSIGEARRMAQMAHEMNVATSLTVNNPSSDSTKLLSEWIADGAIGQVREVHNWSSRPFWQQGIDRKASTGIFGSVPRRSARSTRSISRLSGAAGTISAAVRSATWAATVSPVCSRFWILRRQRQWKPARASPTTRRFRKHRSST